MRFRTYRTRKETMNPSQHKWLIKTDKAEFVIDQAEYEVIKKAALSGKTMVWLESLVISIPHISYMEKIKQPVYKHPQLPEEGVKDMSQKIREAKKKFLNI
jgi:hypothetical protein